MKLIVDIKDNVYHAIHNGIVRNGGMESAIAMDAISSGIVLDGLTNGEAIQKTFPNNRVDIVMGKVYFFTHDDEDEDFDEFAVFNLDWWNSKWEATYEANN